MYLFFQLAGRSNRYKPSRTRGLAEMGVYVELGSEITCDFDLGIGRSTWLREASPALGLTWTRMMNLTRFESSGSSDSVGYGTMQFANGVFVVSAARKCAYPWKVDAQRARPFRAIHRSRLSRNFPHDMSLMLYVKGRATPTCNEHGRRISPWSSHEPSLMRCCCSRANEGWKFDRNDAAFCGLLRVRSCNCILRLDVFSGLNKIPRARGEQPSTPLRRLGQQKVARTAIARYARIQRSS